MAPAPAGRSRPISWPPARILVVDDEADVRDAVCEALTALGYAPDAAGGAAEALERFRPGRYDLVITDFGMPGMNGLQLARRLRALEPGLPITVFSGDLAGADSPTPDLRGLTMAHKPDIDALTQLVERVLTGA